MYAHSEIYTGIAWNMELSGLEWADANNLIWDDN